MHHDACNYKRLSWTEERKQLTVSPIRPIDVGSITFGDGFVDLIVMVGSREYDRPCISVTLDAEAWVVTNITGNDEAHFSPEQIASLVMGHLIPAVRSMYANFRHLT